MAGDDDNEDKQFDATQHKLREQRKKGNVFKSKDITQLAVMITGFTFLFVFGNQAYRLLYELCLILQLRCRLYQNHLHKAPKVL